MANKADLEQALEALQKAFAAFLAVWKQSPPVLVTPPRIEDGK
jgi:hypothetical protein